MMNLAIMSSEPWIWIDLDRSVDDLQNKAVAFRAVTKEEQRVAGKGYFEVISRPNVDNLKRVEIIVNTFDGPEGTRTRFYMPQQAVERIAKNPAGSDTEFSLFLW